MSIKPTFSGAGIYCIEHAASQKVYVGSALNIERRWKRHKADLSAGVHHSVLLQRAWLKYGEEAFAFRLLEIVTDVDLLLEAEQRWIDALQCFLPLRGYNISPTAGSCRGVKHSEKTREKLRVLIAERGHPMRGRTHSDEARARMSASRRGVARGARSDDFRRKMSEVSKGRVISQEQRARISKALKGRKADPDAVPRSAVGHLGTKRTEEVKRRISASNKATKLRQSLERIQWIFCHE